MIVDTYLLRALAATAAAALVLLLLEFLFPARPGPCVDHQDVDPEVWDVLDEARRITQAAAEE